MIARISDYLYTHPYFGHGCFVPAGEQVSIFDDSFDHEVWNNASSPRVVLLIDVWHPDLDAAG